MKLASTANLFVVALASLAISQDAKAPAVPILPVSTKVVYDMKLSLNIGGSDGVLKGTQTSTVKSRDDKGTVWDVTWSGLTLSIGGSDQEGPPFDPFVVTQKPNGALASVTGGPSDFPGAVFVYVGTFFAPTKELAAGESVEVKAEAAGEVPAMTSKVTYVGPDKYKEKAAFKYTQKLVTGASTPMTVESTCWIGADGALLKLDAKVTDMEIAGAGGTGSGTFTLDSK